MFKALLRLNLMSVGRIFTGSSRKSRSGKVKKGSSALYAILILYVVGVFGWMFYSLFQSLAEPLAMLGFGWLYFVYVFIIAFAIMFIFSIFAAKGQLYEAKDNDFLLSLPIPPSAILAGRMAGLILLELGFELLVTVPAGVVWFSRIGVSAVSLVSYIILSLLLPFLCMAFSALFGWLLSLLSSRMHNKTLFEVTVSIIFLAAYFYVYSQINTYISAAVTNSSGIASALGAITPLFWIGDAAASGSVSHLILGILVFLIPFAVAYLILSATFVKTATTKRGAAKKRYEDKGQKVSGLKAALFKREARRLLSSSTYIMNGCLGAVLILAAAVVLIVQREAIPLALAEIGIGTQLMVPIGILIIGFMGGMMQPTSAAVSLEGSALWIIRSLPVAPAEALKAKLGLTFAIFLPPTLLCEVAFVYVLRPSFLLSVIGLIMPLTILVFMGEVGLAINLKHPMLDWTNETVPMKRSLAVILSMLCDLGLVTVLGFGGYFLLDAGLNIDLVLGIFLLLLISASVLLYLWIITKGAAIFSEL